MFPRSKIPILYRLLCLLAYLIVIVFVIKNIPIIIMMISFYILTLKEKRFENIFLYVVTGISFIICIVMNNYFLLRVILVIDYLHYFINVDTLDDFEEIEDDIKKDKHYIRFGNKNKRERVTNNKLSTMFVLVHLIILLLAIMVG